MGSDAHTRTLLMPAIAVVALVATATVGATQATGATEPDGAPEPVTPELALIAEERGITVDEAHARIAWQNEFSIAATDVAEAFPESFAESEITSEMPAVGTIRFKGAVPGGAEELVAGLPESVTVVLQPGARLSARERDERIIEAHKAVSASDLVDVVVSHYDRDAGVVRVAAKPATPMDSAARAAATNQIIANLPASLRGNVSLELRGDLRAGGDARYGGGRLEESGGGALECTSGFNVYTPSINSTTGVATAGHCDNGLTHENNSGSTEYSLDRQGQHRGSWGDFQWHTSADSEPDNFYYSSSSGTRDVRAVANPSEDQTLCRYGQNTGLECDTVRDLSECSSFDGINHCRLVQMDHREAAGGDSGGPWFDAFGDGRTAYGFHSGFADGLDTFSRATYVDNALNVYVRTS